MRFITQVVNLFYNLFFSDFPRSNKISKFCKFVKKVGDSKMEFLRGKKNEENF